MTYTQFTNNDQTLVVLIGEFGVPIVGWQRTGRPITPLNLPGWPDILDAKPNYIYRYKDGVGSVEKYEEINND
jgi:hypothetical protein